MKTRKEWEKHVRKTHSSYKLPLGVPNTVVEIIQNAQLEWCIRPLDTGLYLATGVLEDMKSLCKDCGWTIDHIRRTYHEMVSSIGN